MKEESLGSESMNWFVKCTNMMYIIAIYFTLNSVVKYSHTNIGINWLDREHRYLLKYQLSFENRTTNNLLLKKLKHILNCDYQENLNTFPSTLKNNSNKANCHSSDICLSL